MGQKLEKEIIQTYKDFHTRKLTDQNTTQPQYMFGFKVLGTNRYFLSNRKTNITVCTSLDRCWMFV